MKSTRANRIGSCFTLTAALCATLLAGTVQATRVEREQRKVVPARGQTVVSVSNPLGKTVIVGREGADEVVVVATRVAKAHEREKAEELLARLHYEVRESDGEIVVRTVADGLGGDGRSVWSVIRGDRSTAFIDYAIEVPQRFAVETSTTSGEVRVTNVAGPVVVSATSGAVTLRDIDGAVTVAMTSGTLEAEDLGGDTNITASSGDVTVTGVGGSLTLAASSGDASVARISGNANIQLANGNFELHGCLGDVTFHTSSGDAEILDVQGNINAITSSGDIDVMILPVDGKEFMLSSSSGNIGVHYLTPQDYGFMLDVSTNSGSIEGDMAIKVDKISRRELRGIVGTGASRVMIETARGDVSIVERAEDASKTKKKDRKN